VEKATIAGPEDEPLLDAFYADLYLPAFAHQREPVEAWKRQLWEARELELVITIVGADLRRATRRIDAGIVAERYPRSGCGFLTYLVVAPHARNAGLGRNLLEDARARLATTCALVLAEVSDPRTAGDPATARQRIDRFQRWGARVLDVPYVQPDLGAGLGRDRRLRLLAFFDPAQPPPPAVDGAALRSFLRELYDLTEGPSSDPEPPLASIPLRVPVLPP
jgi:GNAT superfamily N-acetyltransferase